MPAPPTEPARPPEQGEQTKAQAGGAFAFAQMPGLPPVMPGTYRTYREIRGDPTVALARALVMAPIQSAQWSVEASDELPEAQAEDRTELIRRMFIEQRPILMADALRGGLDFGWQGWEKIFETRTFNGRQVQWIRRFKALLQDITTIQADKQTGNFLGFKQGDVELDLPNALLYTHDREGDNHYGRSRLENLRKVFGWWNDANEGGGRYDRKLAGGWITIHYPPGTSIDRTGKERPNHEIAKELGDRIASGGTLTVPNSFAKEVDELNSQRSEKREWIIERTDAQGAASTQFTDRLTYFDKLKFRGMLRPERIGLEAAHGTRGEGETQTDLSLTEGELLHQDIVRTINWHAVDQVLALNYGEEARGSVWISPMPLQDEKRAVFTKILDAFLRNPATLIEVWSDLDSEAIYDLLDLPKDETPEGERDGDDVPPPGQDADDRQSRSIMSLYRTLRQRQQLNGNGNAT